MDPDLEGRQSALPEDVEVFASDDGASCRKRLVSARECLAAPIIFLLLTITMN